MVWGTPAMVTTAVRDVLKPSSQGSTTTVALVLLAPAVTTAHGTGEEKSAWELALSPETTTAYVSPAAVTYLAVGVIVTLSPDCRFHVWSIW